MSDNEKLLLTKIEQLEQRIREVTYLLDLGWSEMTPSTFVYPATIIRDINRTLGREH